MAIKIKGHTIIHDDQDVTSTGSATFDKNSSFNGLKIGRYGQELSGDTNPYNIYSHDGEEHDLTIYGSGSNATLNLRLYDGDLKIGSAASPSYYINNNGAAKLSTLDTGQGANELYDMNQNVKTTSSVSFNCVDTGHGCNEVKKTRVVHTGSLSTKDSNLSTGWTYVKFHKGDDDWYDNSGSTIVTEDHGRVIKVMVTPSHYRYAFQNYGGNIFTQLFSNNAGVEMGDPLDNNGFGGWNMIMSSLEDYGSNFSQSSRMYRDWVAPFPVAGNTFTSNPEFSPGTRLRMVLAAESGRNAPFACHVSVVLEYDNL